MNVIDDPVSLFHALGGLHDCFVVQLTWKDSAWSMVIDDLFSNWMDFEGYSGPLQSMLEFAGATLDEVNLGFPPDLRGNASPTILETTLSIAGDGRISVEMWLVYGRIRLTCS